MLEDLLKGQEKSKRVLIQDTCESPGRILLLNWIKDLLERCDKVILVCSDRPPVFFLNWVPPDLRKRLMCVCGSSELPPDSRGLYLLNVVASNVSAKTGQSAVVVDSLTPFVLSDGADATCALVHRLSQDDAVGQVVSLLHQDVHERHICGLVEHVCSTTVNMQSSVVHNKHICSITHLRSTGKVFKTDEYFTVDDSFRIEKMGQHSEEKSIRSSQPSDDQSIAKLDLPFNLSLTDREKEARSQVQLPFVKYESESPSAAPQSRILYEADDGDDFDEEDPDDDLNI